jgi:glycosyltransferase involved in cell wall biosynthesis
MAALTFVLTCKGRLPHLQQSLPLVTAQPDVNTVVVDVACPQQSANWVRAHAPGVTVLQVHDAAPFNVARARNLGARAATTPWLCFLDSDSLLSPAFSKTVLPLLQNGTYWQADAHDHDLAGLVVCPTQTFNAIGGYDETFEGWGCEDRDLSLRLRLAGCARRQLPPNLVHALTHDDTTRTRFHAVQDRFLSHRINAMYLQIKTDLARQLGVLQLPAEQRAGLYAEIRRITLADPAAPAHLEVNLPLSADFVAPPNWQLTRRWTYSFTPTPPSSQPPRSPNE